MDSLSLVFEFLGRHVHSSLDLFSGDTGDTFELIGNSLFLLELFLLSLEFLVEFSPNDGPSDKLTLGLSSEESEGLMRIDNQKGSISGHDSGAVARVDLHFRKHADFSSDDHLFIIFLIFRI